MISDVQWKRSRGMEACQGDEVVVIASCRVIISKHIYPRRRRTLWSSDSSLSAGNFQEYQKLFSESRRDPYK